MKKLFPMFAAFLVMLVVLMSASPAEARHRSGNGLFARIFHRHSSNAAVGSTRTVATNHASSVQRVGGGCPAGGCPASR